MKMGAGLFWGLLLIIIGLGLVIKIVFNIDFPLFKVLVAFFFIFIGIRILLGSFNFINFKSDSESTVFGERVYYGLPEYGNEYNVIFGKATVDLAEIQQVSSRSKLEVNAIFAGAEIILPDSVPVRIKADVVFGGANLPDGNAGGFGSAVYTSENFSTSAAFLDITVNAIFGGIEVKHH